MQVLVRYGLTLVISGAVVTALQTSDTLPAQGGDIVVTPIYHASVQIVHGGTTIQVDPWGQDLEVFAAALKGEPIEVRIRDWYRGSGGHEDTP